MEDIIIFGSKLCLSIFKKKILTHHQIHNQNQKEKVWNIVFNKKSLSEEKTKNSHKLLPHQPNLLLHQQTKNKNISSSEEYRH